MSSIKIIGRVAVGLGLVACLAAGGCANDQKVINQAVQSNQALQPAIENDPQVVGYMQRVGRRVQQAAQQLDREHQGPDTHFVSGSDNSWMFSDQVQFHLVNSDTLNAFTTGGQHVYVYRKLMDICDTEDQLAAVMAHEFGHIYCRHVHAGMNRQIAMMGAAGLAGVAGYALGGKDNGGEYCAGRGGRRWWPGNLWGWDSRGRTRCRRMSGGFSSIRGRGGTRNSLACFSKR